VVYRTDRFGVVFAAGPPILRLMRSLRTAGTWISVGLLAGAGLSAAGCGPAAAPTCGPGDAAGCTRVLFLGNSYTFVNDLPVTFARLAASAGRRVEVAMVANGGETLSEHAVSTDSLGRIAAGGWSYVVLQDQSETPATETGRDYYTYPAARTLAAKVNSAGAVPMFFMTWAHKDGLPDAGLSGYEAMQQQLDGAYLRIATELRVPVAPVGFTWFMVRRDHPDIVLWADDGSHPSSAGTYLAACVFYASIFRASPEGIAFHGDVPDDQARALQAEAKTQVLDLQQQWGLR